MRAVKKMRDLRGRQRRLAEEESAGLIAECRISKALPRLLAGTVSLAIGVRNAEIMVPRLPRVRFSRARQIVRDVKNTKTRCVSIAGKVPLPMRKGFKAACRRIGIEGLRLRALRYAAVNGLAMSEAALPERSAVFSHGTRARWNRYALLTERHLDEVAGRMAERFCK